MNFLYDIMFTMSLIHCLQVSVFKTTANKAVLNGLRTYFSSTISNKLCCQQMANPCTGLLS
jgi:hypothetical protein